MFRDAPKKITFLIKYKANLIPAVKTINNKYDLVIENNNEKFLRYFFTRYPPIPNKSKSISNKLYL